MGQRHHSLKFMPGKFVFPGGRVEPQDYLASIGSRDAGADPVDKLLRHDQPAARIPSGLYALAHAALRETQEETGIVIGSGAETPESPSLRRRISRASRSWPARSPRRAGRAASIRGFSSSPPTASPSGPRSSTANSSPWNGLRMAEARQQDLPSITRMMLDDLDARIAAPARCVTRKRQSRSISCAAPVSTAGCFDFVPT